MARYITLWRRIVKGLELALIAGSIAGATQLFIRASEPNSNPLFALGGIIFTALLFGSLGDCARRITNERKLKYRLLRLKELHKQGHLLSLEAHNKIKNDSQKDLWWAKVVSWKDEVCLIMRQIRKGDCEKWLTLNEYIPKCTLFNEDMSNKANSLSAWVEKLSEYNESGTNVPKVD